MESVEMLTRSSMHKIGSIVLEKLLNADDGGNRENIQKCGCGKEAKFIEVREKEVLTVVGKICLKRNYYYDSHCGQGWCPKDLDLGIEGNSNSPGVQRMMARVGSFRSFGLGEDDIRELAGLSVTAKAIERTCHEVGKEAEAFLHNEQLEKPVQTKQTTPIKTMYVEIDGTGVSVVKAETVGRKGKQADGAAKTREAKLGCVFTQTTVDKDNHPIRDENSASYIGAIENAEEFGKDIYAETRRRGIKQAARVCILGDGAQWIWNIALTYFLNAVQIVDLFHAREYYWKCAQIVFVTNRKRMLEWTQQRKKELDNGEVEAVIKAVKRLHVKSEEARAMCQAAVRYYEQNKERMRYNIFREQGFFVGSGVIEAGCRTVVGQRLKQSGMHWTVKGANNIIALRCIQLSHRWEDFWQYRAAA